MKKKYVRPVVAVVPMEVQTPLLASSYIQVGGGYTNRWDSREHRGRWGNLWKEEE